MSNKTNKGRKPMSVGTAAAITAVIFFAFFAIVLILAVSEPTDSTVEATSNNSSTTAAADTATEAESIIGISDTLHAQNFDFQILSAGYYDSLTTAMTTYTPDEGNRFLLVVFRATNTSDDVKNVEFVDFNSYIDDSKVVPESIVGEFEGYMPLLGAVTEGKHFDGYTVWQVPENWNTFTFSYIDSLTGEDSDDYFTIYASDIS